jgi:hypothetical protein
MGIGGCFTTGSRIRTLRGEVAVEDLYVGDEVVTLRDGAETHEPVIWVGRRPINIATHAQPEVAAPVRVRKDAIAEGQPVRDLFLSQDHSLFLDGKCVPVLLLVNGGSITVERGWREVTYFHVELSRHSILLAEGLLAESYLDTGNRDWFVNADEPVVLHPNFSINPSASAWLTHACAPLASAGDEVKPIWTRLAQRSKELGYTPVVARTTQDAEIRLTADGSVIRPTSTEPGTYSFVVPAGVSSVRLDSRFGIPVDLEAAYISGDDRRLGVLVTQITTQSGTGKVVITADDPRLTDGWYIAETTGAATWRWTNGSAALPWSGFAGPTVVTIQCKTLSAYPIYDEMLRLVA